MSDDGYEPPFPTPPAEYERLLNDAKARRRRPLHGLTMLDVLAHVRGRRMVLHHDLHSSEPRANDCRFGVVNELRALELWIEERL